jgi:hypothetical protein
MSMEYIGYMDKKILSSIAKPLESMSKRINGHDEKNCSFFNMRDFESGQYCIKNKSKHEIACIAAKILTNSLNTIRLAVVDEYVKLRLIDPLAALQIRKIMIWCIMNDGHSCSLGWQVCPEGETIFDSDYEEDVTDE